MQDPLSSGSNRKSSDPKEPASGSKRSKSGVHGNTEEDFGLGQQDRSSLEGAAAGGSLDDRGPAQANLFSEGAPGVSKPHAPQMNPSDSSQHVSEGMENELEAIQGTQDRPQPPTAERYAGLWDQLLASIRHRMQPEQFATWFSRADLVRVDDEQLEIAVMNDFARGWVESYHLGAVEAAITEVLGTPRQLVLTVDPELARATLANQVLTPHGQPEATGRPTSAQEPSQPASPAKPSGSTGERPPTERTMMEGGRPGLLWSSDVELHPRYTFENYVVGPCNRFGHAAAMGAAEQPGKNYNPFFLHGRVGVGKTHLLQAICHLILERQPASRILYLSCETFINHFISALQDGDTTTFRNKYRYVDVLVVDDIHLLANKERTQEEFFHTFNTLYQAGKQIVLSSDSPPKDIPTLQDRLVSRFKWGMVTEIEPPCFETRMAIVKQKSSQENNEFPTVVAEYIASHFEDNVRELEGAVTRLLAFSSMTGQPVDMAIATEALSSFLKVTHGQPTLTDVVDTVSKHYRLKPSDLQSSKRTRTIAFPRHVAMYLARTVTSNSFETIGAHFGGRDHSSVVYAVSKISKLIAEGNSKSEEVGRLYTELTGRKLETDG